MMSKKDISTLTNQIAEARNAAKAAFDVSMGSLDSLQTQINKFGRSSIWNTVKEVFTGESASEVLAKSANSVDKPTAADKVASTITPITTRQRKIRKQYTLPSISTPCTIPVPNAVTPHALVKAFSTTNLPQNPTTGRDIAFRENLCITAGDTFNGVGIEAIANKLGVTVFTAQKYRRLMFPTHSNNWTYAPRPSIISAYSPSNVAEYVNAANTPKRKRNAKRFVRFCGNLNGGMTKLQARKAVGVSSYYANQWMEIGFPKNGDIK